MTAFRHVLALLLLGSFIATPDAQSQTAKGSVFHDFNENGKRDAGEPGIGGILVSNQIEVVKTDSDGNWELPSREDCIYFVNKPSGWMTPVDSKMLPRFYYNHKPKGSPKTKFAGVPPTGTLPASIDFPLTKQTEPGLFKAIFMADPQSRNQKELDYFARDIVEELMGTEGRFGVTLGDILFDDLALYDNHNALVALIGVPWYNVIGNHDLNFDAPNDIHSDETFERIYGPAYYAYSYGPVNFIVLDNVNWKGREKGYDGNLGADQLTFVENLVQHLPEDELLVLLMHIPLGLTKDREKLFRLIEQRPYTLSLAGHTHWQEHQFLDANDGWRGTNRHQHVVAVTASGSWWGGEPDETGIPNTMMRDGAPNGYLLVTFNGQQAIIDFKAARRPADYQIRVSCPDSVSVADAPKHELFANVFNGSEKSTVRFRIGKEGPWMEMKKTVEPDPDFL
ncbi:MAG: calcineurin-like phosphoesterase family protein, partial [Verrucomicrobiota bacterium]